MICSIIIPTFNHAQCISEAIDSAFAQTVACEVIVVDDGSSDETSKVLAVYDVRVISQPHRGPSAARNAGIDASTGEFVMFLDADDVIAPTKVEEQIAELNGNPDAGWVLCDVRIEDEARGTVENASQRYRYADKELSGWIRPLLVEGNFIPIMSPLVRRSALGAIRFDDALIPEDWHFWCAVASVARVRYLPKVLATYRKSRSGRSRIPLPSRHVVRNIDKPLRLNLGCGTEHTRSWHPLPGLVNLDKSMGWRFEDGLGDFVTGSVAGITVSHSLMYVDLADWPRVFQEFARVLMPGGVLRITEDDTGNPASRTYPNGWRGSEPAVTLTTAATVRVAMERAGLTVAEVTRESSRYADNSLCQAFHGDPPHVFFIESVKQSAVLFAPHNDDESLFAAFTILRYRPRVVICFKSSGDYGDPEIRERETQEAMAILGGHPVTQWDGGDLVAQMRELDRTAMPTQVWAPDVRASHPQHVAVARAAAEVFGDRLITYHTYDESGKVATGQPVEFEPSWVLSKLRALARYESQATHPRANAFFMQNLNEYRG